MTPMAPNHGIGVLGAIGGLDGRAAQPKGLNPALGVAASVQPLAICLTLADAAVAAWAKVGPRANRHEKVGQGAGGNPTSRADSELEGAILKVAERLKLSVLSEEAGLVDRGSGLLAVVDPLDGSRNAGRGIPLHCTSIAVARNGTKAKLSDLVAGVVVNLVTGETYTAEKGKGAKVDGKAPKPPPFDPDEVVVGVIADYASTEIEEAHRHRAHHLRDLGSAALEICLVGTGALDAFVVRRPWLRTVDIAAATLFLREAGGIVLDPATGRELEVPLNMEVRTAVLAARSPEALRAVQPGTQAATSRTPPKSRKLTWAIVGKGTIPHVRKECDWLAGHLRKAGQEVLLETSLAAALGGKGHTLAELDAKADLFATVGGDGTILMTQAVTEKPVLGINAGAIGFLAEVDPPQAAVAVDQVLKGDYRIEERNKLSSWLDDKRLPDATNEVTLQTSRIAKLIQFRIAVASEHLDTLRGDGLIVSTATGSTGYAMSVGGPLVHPMVHGTVLAPIAPFRLAARPWVVPSDAPIEITLMERDSTRGGEQARVVVDGQHGFGLGPGSTVRIQPSERKARFIRLGSGFYERVRTKLTR